MTQLVCLIELIYACDHVVLTKSMLDGDCTVRITSFALNQCFERKENQYSLCKVQTGKQSI